MDQSLVERMREYLNAGLAMDVEALDALYDPDFENIRCDEAGQVVTLTKGEFMARFRALRDQGQRVGETVDDVRFLATTVYGDQGSIVMHRLEDGVPARYNFVWHREGSRWATLVREFTFERDITPLIQMVQAARGASA
ncbi:nuclear transport factor 2 family protein [Streptomyces sp. ISL-66]|uniref:nuclear transport factor 2 family protein n=1 Tax=Streptomyces sp. ISL-66 TaxID=2819186 RepID=UPI001BE5BDBD|nr:nuclear transport factor 2 family protein [Streptomyces sp. ISL-66]MBT2468124.1 nuclear transport factor 2 family protein [Streptomyces sp. ISL-66]